MYRESLVRFRKFREQERIQRLSMGANELAAYQSISDERQNLSAGNTTPTDQHHVAYQPNTCPSKSYRTQSSIERSVAIQQNGQTKKINVQFHLNESTTDDCDSNFDYRKPRHSMPATTSDSYLRSARRIQQTMDAQTIREEDIEKFEEAHCMNSVNVDEHSAYRSPPMKFYKQNLDPFMSNSETSSLHTLGDAQPMRGKCPEKPKRLLVNSKQSRKLLTEAHFTGAYRNFEIQSPYYSDTSSLLSSVANQKQPPNSADSLNGDNSSALAHYQVIVNKHGDEVEYALPCVDIPEYQRRQKLPNCLTSDDSILAGEIFHEDPKVCDQILSENFELTSKTSISMHEQIPANSQRNGRVMITDLDKSTDSVNTFDDLDNITGNGHASRTIDLHMRTPNRVLQFHETMQCADIICLISEFESKRKMDSTFQTPLHYEWGIFKGTNVTVRKYADLPIDDKNQDFTLIAETAIIRDAEVLR